MKIDKMMSLFPNEELQKAITAGEKGEVAEGLFALNLFKSEKKNELIPVYLKAIQALQKNHEELAVRLVDKFQIEAAKEKAPLSEEIQKLAQEVLAPVKQEVDDRKVKKAAQTKIAIELFGKNEKLLNVLLYGKRANKGYATWKDFAKNLSKANDPELSAAYKAILQDQANLAKYPEVIVKLRKKLRKIEKEAKAVEKVEEKKEEKPVQKVEEKKEEKTDKK
jgi:hypothetical protein